MKILYITCLNSEKEKYDGERIKNTLIFNSLKKYSDVDVIDFTTHKYWNIFKTFWCGLFKKKKYDYIFISKDPHGANIIRKVLSIGRVNPDKVVYFEIGPFLYSRIMEGSINKKTFIKDKLIIVETASMKEELESIGFERIDIFPNFKPIFEIPFNEQQYPKETLKLVYLSRIEDKKGIYDLVDCLKTINEDKTLFTLDVYGRPQNKNEEERIYKIDKELPYVSYKGKIDIDGPEAYKELSQYDLHVFPTKYSEGFPGTIIDFFIAGVPTLASSFKRSNDILTDKDSIIFEQYSKEDLLKTLRFIYDNQTELIELRKHSFDRRKDYSVQAFERYLEQLLDRLNGK